MGDEISDDYWATQWGRAYVEFAAGEAAGFGGGGAHGYNALEGTFLGQCVFTGLTVGRALAKLL